MQVLCWQWAVWYVVIMPSLAAATPANQGLAWQLSGLSVQSHQTGVSVGINSLSWQDLHVINTIEYNCPGVLLVYPRHHCGQVQLSFNYGGQDYQANLSSTFDFARNDWQLMLSTQDEQLSLSLTSDQPIGKLQFSQLKLDNIFSQLLPATKVPDLGATALDGVILLDLDKLQLSAPEAIVFNGVSYEYSDDVIVAELAGEMVFELDIRQQHLSYEIALNAGEMLLNEVYVDFSAYPVTVKGTVAWQGDGWYLVSTEIVNQQSLVLNAAFSINEAWQWRAPHVVVSVTDSHHFNQQILSSVLGIYGFGNSGMSGQFTLTLATEKQSFDHWTVEFNDYYFLNERRKIATEALYGLIDWRLHQTSKDSTLRWQNLLLAGLPIAESGIKFNVSKDQLHFIGSQHLPVFNGAIELQELKLGALFSDSIEMSLNASILPISLKLITEKMGWPVMAGSISGNIPGMVKQGSVIRFLGALDLQVFEGEMLIDNLSLERLFGVAPVIAADVKFNGFDLSLLTETFGFGLITGKLSGVIDDLRITNWKTDRLDAEVYTVKTKGIKQTISQRAIDNISSLGGIKGAISKTFLRFFDDFRYQKIKLSCKLHNSVCQIGGLKNQSNQFVIVEGGGIPKINIVGYVRSINWEEFVSRLLNANYDN